MDPSVATWAIDSLGAAAGVCILAGSYMQAIDSLHNFQRELRVIGYEGVAAYFSSLKRSWKVLLVPLGGIGLLAVIYAELKSRLDSYKVEGHSDEWNRAFRRRLVRALRLTIEWGLIMYGGLFVVAASTVVLCRDAGLLS